MYRVLARDADVNKSPALVSKLQLHMLSLDSSSRCPAFLPRQPLTFTLMPRACPEPYGR